MSRLLRRKRSSSFEDIPLDIRSTRHSSSTSSLSKFRNGRTTPEELELVSSSASETVDLLCVRALDEEESNSSDSSLSVAAGCRKDKVLLPEDELIRFQRQELDDVEKYMASREMTPTQERWNALTMIPNVCFCLFFILSGTWVSHELVEEARNGGLNDENAMLGFGGLVNRALANVDGCLTSTWHGMPTLPPLTVLAVAIGICIQAPFSFLYHWKYAWQLPPGAPRITHWSRRMDHSTIHVASAFLAYATSGSWDFFWINVFYNMDCIYRQFQRKVRPRRNKIRVGLSILAYTLPILRHGDWLTFLKLWFVFGVSGWLFAKYPIGGWSHSAFHIVLCLVPPLVMNAALNLPVSHSQLELAAQCTVLAERAAKGP